MAPRVLVVGSVNMDLIVRCKRVPGEGETVSGEDLVTANGGKGANQAVAAARLGAKTSFIGRVGEDEFGPRLRAGLEADGINTTALHTDPGAASGVALILLEEGGANRIVVMGGANGRVGAEEVASARRLLRESDVLLLQLEIPLGVVAEIAKAAREMGVPSVLDAGPATSDAADLVGLVDIVSPNEHEAAILTGMEVGEAKEAAARLQAMGARQVVMKLGAAGAYWRNADGEGYVPGFKITPVDTTAAGDAFTASLAVSIASDLSLPEAVKRANGAGALACLKLGAQPSMPTRAELEQFLKGN